jgi:hypothetical protein
MYGCVYGSSNLLAAMDCEACLVKSVPAAVHYCRDLEGALEAVPDCPCAPCGHQIVTYVMCALRNVTGCAVNASSAIVQIEAEETPAKVCEGLGCALPARQPPQHPGGGGGGAVAALSTAVACQTERQAYGSCLETSSSTSSALDGSAATLACEQCLAGSVPLPGSGATCGDYQTSACSAVAHDCQSVCANHGCIPELETYLGCSFSNQLESTCEIACDTAGGGGNDARNSDAPCTEQVDALATCLETFELGTGRVDACPTCVTAAFNGSDLTAIGCDALEQDVCPALQQCDCGSCGDIVEGYFACVAHATAESCDGTECNVTNTSSPSTDDTSNSTTRDSSICNSAFVAIRQCLLVEELGTGLYESCPACVSNSFPVGSDASSVTCDQLGSEVCREIKSCDCGSCQELVAGYFDCVAVTTPASCNGVSYDTCFGGPPTVPSSPSSATVPSAPSAIPSATTVPTSSPVAAPSQGTSPTSALPTTATSPAPSALVSPTIRPARSDAPVAPNECSGKEQSMQTCLREQLTVSEQDCLNCVDAIEKAINDPLENCPSINSAVCTIVTGVCSCGDCTSLVNSYYSCAAQLPGTNCTVDCGITTQSPASAPPGTSGAGRMIRGYSALMGWSGIVIVLLNFVSLL